MENLIVCKKLPAWLRNKKCIYSVDGYYDNLSFWRCLQIYRGNKNKESRPAKDITRKSLRLARFFYDNTKLKVREVEKTSFIEIDEVSKMYSVNFRVFELNDGNKWVLTHGKDKNENELPIVNIGYYDEHFFFIKDIEVLKSLWICSKCHHKFKRHDNYKEHFLWKGFCKEKKDN